MVLCDAATLGDVAAAQKWGVSLRSIRRWRSRIKNGEGGQEEDSLGQMVASYSNLYTKQWLDDVPTLMSAVVQYFTSAAQQMEPNQVTPADLVAAFTAIADVQMTQQILQSRLNGEQSDAD